MKRVAQPSTSTVASNAMKNTAPPQKQVVRIAIASPTAKDPVPEKVEDQVSEESTLSSSVASSHPTESSPPQSSTPVQRRSPNEVNISKDVYHKLVPGRGAGNFKYIPLSAGRMIDFWWRPLECLVHIPDGSTYPVLILKVQGFLDAPGFTISPNCDEMQIKFKADPIEILKIAYLYNLMIREMQGEKYQDYNIWYREVSGKFRNEDTSEAEFASMVINEILKQDLTMIPSTFGIFLSKKPSLSYEYPSAAPRMFNKNTMEACARTTGFIYEFRVRLFNYSLPILEDEEISSQPMEEGDGETVLL